MKIKTLSIEDLIIYVNTPSQFDYKHSIGEYIKEHWNEMEDING